MLFQNVADPRRTGACGMPDYFIDLNLDQIIDSLAENKEEYGLKNIFYTTLSKVDEIEYRQEVMKDLESPGVFEAIKKFS
jgi:hypothetical protein